ncbi:MAG: hypothetical protein ACO34D_03685 [Burkholderiaceae bacterium]
MATAFANASAASLQRCMAAYDLASMCQPWALVWPSGPCSLASRRCTMACTNGVCVTSLGAALASAGTGAGAGGPPASSHVG